MSSTLVLVLVATIVAGLASALVPQAIARLPEPAPLEPDEIDPLAPPEPKQLYVDLAHVRGLRGWSVLVGAAAGATCGLAVASLDLPGLLPGLMLLVPLGVALGYVDARTRLLPSALIMPAYPTLVALLLIGALIDGTWRVLVGAAVGWLIMGGLFFVLNLVYPAGMGFGDVRLSGLLGLVLGYAGLAPLLVGVESAFVMGAVGGLAPVLWRRLRRQPRVRGYPFGPYMLLGTLVGLLFGDPLVAALMGGAALS